MKPPRIQICQGGKAIHYFVCTLASNSEIYNSPKMELNEEIKNDW